MFRLAVITNLEKQYENLQNCWYVTVTSPLGYSYAAKRKSVKNGEAMG